MNKHPTPVTEKMLTLARLEREQAPEVERESWLLIHRGRAYALPRSGSLTIGRGLSCEIVLTAAVVSREHCRVDVSGEGVSVVDLDSSNGVYVNGQRVDGARKLSAGDALSIGRDMLMLCSMILDTSPSGVRSLARAQLPQADEPPDSSQRDRTAVDPQSLTTQKADAFETLGRLADRMLVSGQLDAAEKLLSGHLHAVLLASHNESDVPDEVIEISSRYALKLAAARLDGAWVDLVVACHAAFRRPLSAELLEQTRALLAHRLKVDRELLERYQEILKSAVREGTLVQTETVWTILALKPG